MRRGERRLHFGPTRTDILVYLLPYALFLLSARVVTFFESTKRAKTTGQRVISHLLKDHAGCSLSGDVAQNCDGDDGDDGQRDEVGEREERGEDASRRIAFTDTVNDAIRPQYRHVDGQHQHPDGGDGHHHVATGAYRRRANAVDDGHVSDDGDEDQRVDGDIGGHVDEIVHQLAGGVTERPR